MSDQAKPFLSKLKLRFAVVNGLATGWLSLACAAPVLGATLGALQLRSALGERLDVSIPVTVADNEDLSSGCFRLVNSEQSTELQSLHQARLTFDMQGSNRGVLQIRSDEAQSEPLLALVVRVQCPGDTTVSFQREYQVLLDPRERMPQINLPRTDDQSGAVPAPRRAEQNTDSMPAASTASAPHKARKQRTPHVAAASHLSLQEVPPASVPGAPAPQLVLRLSEPEIPAASLTPLSPEDAQKRRAELAALSVDQAAQLAQMEAKLAELNARLQALQGRMQDGSQPAIAVAQGDTSAAMPAVASGTPARRPHVAALVTPAAPVAEATHWWWWLLLPVLLIAALVSLIYWRSRRQWRALDEGDDDLIEHEHEADDEWPEPTPRVLPVVAAAPVAVARADLPVAVPTAVTDAAAMSQNMGQGWHDADVDVVQPDNVSDEAQLLIEHGLTEHAITLLSQEIEMRPNSLALWMKLFEAYRLTGLKEEFQEQALAFGMLFASDSLWHQVQDIGRTLDPANPLYHSVDETEDMEGMDAMAHEMAPLVHTPLAARNISAFEPVAALDPDAPLEMSQRLPDVAPAPAPARPVAPVMTDALDFSPVEVPAPKVVPVPAPAMLDAGDPLEFDLQPIDLPLVSAPPASQPTSPADGGEDALEFDLQQVDMAPSLAVPASLPAIMLDNDDMLDGISFETDPSAEPDPFAGLQFEAETLAAPEQAQELVVDGDEETIDLAGPAPLPDDGFDLRPPLPLPVEAGWQSNDPALQGIAAMLERGETEVAFRALEELLYTGNGEQRQLALKWLERLYPAKRA